VKPKRKTSKEFAEEIESQRVKKNIPLKSLFQSAAISGKTWYGWKSGKEASREQRGRVKRAIKALPTLARTLGPGRPKGGGK